MTSNPVVELLTVPRHRPQPQPPACEQRQPLQRKPVQDPQVLPGVPRTVRLHRGRAHVLRDVLRVLQPRAPPLRHRLPHTTSIHYGTATEVRAQRQVTLDAAYAGQPSGSRHRRPEPPKLPTVAWINEPTEEPAQTA